jgi:hypothetical protein
MRAIIGSLGLLCGAGAIGLTLFCVWMLYEARANDHNVYVPPEFGASHKMDGYRIAR